MRRHHRIWLGLAVAAFAASSALAAPQVITLGGGDVSDDPVAACGDLAASPFEPGRDGRGLPDDAVFLDGALAACEAALSASPDSAEAMTWLGRVLVLVGRAEEAAPLLEAAADAGNPFAAFILSGLLSNASRDGVDDDEERAAALLAAASDGGFAPAETAIAKRLETDGAYVHALDVYGRASEHGDPIATYKLGYFHHFGFGVDIDYPKARDFYERAAAAGEPLGNNGIGQMYEYGQGEAQDYAKAAEFYQLAADKKEMMSETSLAYLYEQGLGVTQDYDKSFALLLDASAQGYGYAHAALSLHYLYGQGTAVDEIKAYDFAWLAQQKNIVYAEGILGYLFAEGIGTNRDLSNALFHFQAGSQGGDQYSTDRIPVIEAEIACADAASSPFETGNIGHGVAFEAIDPAIAIPACENALSLNPEQLGDRVWLGRALVAGGRQDEALPHLNDGVAAGNVLAQTVLGDMLMTGNGVETDKARAVELYQAAAAQFFGPAEFALGSAYLNGDGVEADPAQAEKWFRLALDHGIAAEDQIDGLHDGNDSDVDMSGFGREGPGY